MKAKVSLERKRVVSKIDERLYGSFIEHMGRAVYTGIYEKEHESSDEFGFRRDVMELIRPLSLSHIRYPGGNFLSGYDWKDGIGSLEKRPLKPDLAWFALEPNTVGTDEFLQWCERLGTKAMLGVNLGTSTPQSAIELLDYVNGTRPTHFAVLRRKNGREEPYGVKLWCLGNEMDGPWQICAKTADEYGRIACESAKMMKWLEPEIELVACGSSFRAMPSFGEWERTVLRHCAEHVDYLSLHQYYQNNDGDIPSFLARSVEMDGFIKEVAAICAQASSKKEIKLSFDEWNVWYHFQKAGRFPPKWTIGRAIEEELYDFSDALLIGCMMNTLINNSDSVKIACLAQLVNTIAPIMTEPGGRAWVQSIYYPFLYASKYGRGTALRVGMEVPGYDCADIGDVPYLDCAAVLSEGEKELCLFMVNRSMESSLTLELSLSGLEPLSILERGEMSGFAPSSCNTAEASPVKVSQISAPFEIGAPLSFTLPAFSWNFLRIELA